MPEMIQHAHEEHDIETLAEFRHIVDVELPELDLRSHHQGVGNDVSSGAAALPPWIWATPSTGACNRTAQPARNPPPGERRLTSLIRGPDCQAELGKPKLSSRELG